MGKRYRPSDIVRRIMESNELVPFVDRRGEVHTISCKWYPGDEGTKLIDQVKEALLAKCVSPGVHIRWAEVPVAELGQNVLSRRLIISVPKKWPADLIEAARAAV